MESRIPEQKEQADLMEEIWSVSRLNDSYHKFLAALHEQSLGLDFNAYQGGGGLPFLHRFGLEFFEIVRDDPHLPRELLPEDWMGIKAALAFQNIRKEILPKANHSLTGFWRSRGNIMSVIQIHKLAQ